MTHALMVDNVLKEPTHSSVSANQDIQEHCVKQVSRPFDLFLQDL